MHYMKLEILYRYAALLIVTEMGYYLPSLKIMIIKRDKKRVVLSVAKAGLRPIERFNGYLTKNDWNMSLYFQNE